MKTQNFNKLLLTFSALTVFSLPTISTIACSKNNQQTQPPTKPDEGGGSTGEEEDVKPQPPAPDKDKIINLEPTEYQLVGNNWMALKKGSDLRSGVKLPQELNNILFNSSAQWYENDKPIHYTMTFDIDDTWFIGKSSADTNKEFDINNLVHNFYKQGFAFKASFDISKDEKGRFVIKANDEINRKTFKNLLSTDLSDDVFIGDLNNGYVGFDWYINSIKLIYDHTNITEPLSFDFRYIMLNSEEYGKWIKENNYEITEDNNDTKTSKFFVSIWTDSYKNVNAKVSIKRALNL